MESYVGIDAHCNTGLELAAIEARNGELLWRARAPEEHDTLGFFRVPGFRPWSRLRNGLVRRGISRTAVKQQQTGDAQYGENVGSPGAHDRPPG